MCNTYEVNHLFLELSLGLTVVQTESVNINIRMTEVILISHRIAKIAPINIFVSTETNVYKRRLYRRDAEGLHKRTNMPAGAASNIAFQTGMC